MYGTSTAATRRRASRYLRRRERENNIRILLGGGHGVPLTTTIALLRKGAPELVDDRNRTLGIVEEYMDEVREDILATRRYARGLAARVRANSASIDGLSQFDTQ